MLPSPPNPKSSEKCDPHPVWDPDDGSSRNHEPTGSTTAANAARIAASVALSPEFICGGGGDGVPLLDEDVEEEEESRCKLGCEPALYCDCASALEEDRVDRADPTCTSITCGAGSVTCTPPSDTSVWDSLVIAVFRILFPFRSTLALPSLLSPPDAEVKVTGAPRTGVHVSASTSASTVNTTTCGWNRIAELGELCRPPEGWRRACAACACRVCGRRETEGGSVAATGGVTMPWDERRATIGVVLSESPAPWPRDGGIGIREGGVGVE